MGKFLLTFLLTKKISLEFQGSFSLISTNIALLIMFLGLDVYVYTNRLMVKDKSRAVFYLKNSLVFYALMYLLLIPVVYILVKINLISSNFFWLFVLTVILEHLGQEFFRAYIAFEKVLIANILLFLRTGAWAIPLVLYLLFCKEISIKIEHILICWATVSFLCVILGFALYPDIKKIFNTSIDIAWIKKGISVGAFMFISTILLKIIEYSDRYIIDFFLDKKQLGIYFFYFQIANIINVIIYTLYISFAYPKILKSVYSKNLNNLNQERKIITRSTILIVSLVILSIFILFPFLLEYINKPGLENEKIVFYIIGASTIFLNLSYTSHFVLIGDEKEKTIIKVTFIACVVNLILNFILIPLIGIIGAAITLLISNVILFTLKKYEENKIVAEW